MGQLKAKIIKFVNSQIIILAVIAGTIPALIFPETSETWRQAGLTPWLIAGVFLCQGLGLNPKDKIDLSHNLKIIFFSMVASFIIFPLIAYATLHFAQLSTDNYFGLMLICCMPCTLVSGIVISDLAGGDRASALFITIALNCSAVIISPLLISFYLSSTAEVDTLSLIQKLTLTVFIPALCGWGIRKKIKLSRNGFNLSIKYLPVLFLGTVIFVNTGGQKDQILKSSLNDVVYIALLSAIIHLIALYLFKSFGKQTSMSDPQNRSFSICCSQKTLPLAIAIWSAHFAQSFPTALIATMIYHLVQIYLDSFIAQKWAKKKKLS
ncbi:bile acid:sodium symporter [Lentisphaera marina]|uniref:bile acid:sodium symporter family protein n=1 Tax=Lentisphaera marina TaxID=1111041 RepID=UPI002365149B|nr:bile acid:sodium symporter [Lentisphaera marina]MDD7984847.1 bile acid:sodium symporter [Lentisphaera marina]